MASANVSSLPETRPGQPLRVAVAGLGAVGLQVAQRLKEGLPGFVLGAVAVRDKDAARRKLGDEHGQITIVGIDELEPYADVVVECAPAALLREIVLPFVNVGKKAIVLSCGALLRHMDLVDVARESGGQIIVPSGALLGLDAVSAAAEGEIRSVRMTTRKPVSGLVGAPYLVSNNIDIEDITEPLRIFSGTARQAAAGFPANLNVAVALSLAGSGPDETQLDIWADPGINRNTHHIQVDSDSASFSMSIENVPTDNPKTGRITALSVIAALKRLRAPLRVGT